MSDRYEMHRIDLYGVIVKTRKPLARLHGEAVFALLKHGWSAQAITRNTVVPYYTICKIRDSMIEGGEL